MVGRKASAAGATIVFTNEEELTPLTSETAGRGGAGPALIPPTKVPHAQVAARGAKAGPGPNRVNGRGPFDGEANAGPGAPEAQYGHFRGHRLMTATKSFIQLPQLESEFLRATKLG